jgi:hypothetical protein
MEISANNFSQFFSTAPLGEPKVPSPIDVGFHIRGKSSTTLATLGRGVEADIYVERIQHRKDLMLFRNRSRNRRLQRSPDGCWTVGSSILHEAFSIRRPYCKLRRMASGRPYVCIGRCARGGSRRASLARGRIYLLSIRRDKHSYTRQC